MSDPNIPKRDLAPGWVRHLHWLRHEHRILFVVSVGAVALASLIGVADFFQMERLPFEEAGHGGVGVGAGGGHGGLEGGSRGAGGVDRLPISSLVKAADANYGERRFELALALYERAERAAEAEMNAAERAGADGTMMMRGLRLAHQLIRVKRKMTELALELQRQEESAGQATADAPANSGS